MASIEKREYVNAKGKRVVRYDATVTRRGAKRQYRTFLAKSDAEKWARKVEGEIQSDTWVDVSAAQMMTVGRALDLYLSEVAPNLKSADCEPPKAGNLKRRLGNIPLSSLSTIDLASYRDKRLKDKARRGVGRKGAGTVELDRTISPQTVRHELGLLNRALAHVQHEHGISFPRGRPQLDHSQNNALSLPPGRDRILSPEEKERVLAACKPKQITTTEKYAGLKTARSTKLLPAVEFMLETAARPGEVAVLRWRETNMTDCTATLKNKKKKQSKAPETRTIPLSPRAKAILEARPRPHGRDDFVFGGVTRSSLYQAFRRALRRAKVTDFSTRDLRHCGATQLANVFKGDLLMLSDMTGHQDIRMLRRYVAPRRWEIARLLEASAAQESDKK